MPAGTIKLTNNSTAVTGTGTSFSNELAANDFLVVVVGGVTCTLGVKSVESNTGLTLLAAYNGPTTTGLAWTPVPNATLVGITAQVAADVAKAIRGLNLDKNNWQQVFSGSGNITVTLPDGSQYSGPSWGNIITSLNNKAASGDNSDIKSLSGLTTALSISQGGTGAKNAAEALSSLKGVSTDTAQTITAQKTFSGAGLVVTSFSRGLEVRQTSYPSIHLVNWDNGETQSGRRVVLEQYLGTFYVSRRTEDNSSTGGTTVTFPNSSGTIALAASSDRRLKKEDGLTPAGALSRLAKLRVVDFHYAETPGYISAEVASRQRRGFIAQEAYEADPTYANKPFENPEGELPEIGGTVPWELNEHGIIADLVLAVRELQQTISAQDEQIAELQERMKAIDGLDK